MRYSELFEARSNADHPSQQKTTALDNLKKYFDRDWLHSNYGVYPDDVYISFTSVDKIGINPSSKYNTPIGIYCYPLSDYKKTFLQHNRIMVPFAGGSPYINVLIDNKSDTKILNFDSYDRSQYDADISVLREYFISRNDEDTFDFYVSSGAEHGTNWGKNIWNITRLLGMDWSENDDRSKHGNKAKPASVLWNYLLRVVLGYGLVYDSGHSIIHENEPTQAVFLSIKSFDLVEVIRNEKQNSGLLNTIINKGKSIFGKIDKKFVHDFILKNYKFGSIGAAYLYPNAYFELPSDVVLSLIKSDPEWITKIKTVTDGKLDDIEKYLLYEVSYYDYYSLTHSYLAYFITHIKKERIKEYEDKILSDGYPLVIYHYIDDILKRRWPEAEPALARAKNLYIQYQAKYHPESKPEKNKISDGEEDTIVGSKVKLKNGEEGTIVGYAGVDKVMIAKDDGDYVVASYDDFVG